jgi:hypothetical protein
MTNNYTKAISRAMLPLLLLLLTIVSVHAQTIWSVGSTTFTKTAPGQSDAVAANTSITRGNTGPLYNSVCQSAPIGSQYPTWSGPCNTQWAIGTIANWNTLTYANLYNVNGFNPPSMVGQTMVCHLIAENIYFQVTWNSWQSGGGNFSYTRTTTVAAACSGTPTPGTVASTGGSSFCPGASTLSLSGATVGTGLTYQWYYSAVSNAGPWTNLGTNSSQSATGTAGPAYYYCTISCGVNSASTPVVSYTLNPYYNCYCTNTISQTGDEDIINVTLNGVSRSSTCASLPAGTSGILEKYTNWQPLGSMTTLAQAGSYAGSFTAGTCGSYYGEAWAGYIDFNCDGDFNDPNEQVMSGSGTNPGVVNFSVNVPSTAGGGLLSVGTPTVLTGMRIMYYEQGSVPAACSNGSYGEYEDFLITLQYAPPCSGTPNPGNTLSSAVSVCSGASYTVSLQNTIVGTGISYQWESAPDVSGVPGTFTPVALATNASLTTNQTTATWYHCIVTCSAGPPSDTSVDLLVPLAPGSSCYCIPSYVTGIQFGDLISNVSITGTTLSNNTGFATFPNISYTHFNTLPNHTTTLLPATSYTVSVSTGEWGDQGYAAWIDYNDDGIFATPSERIGATAGTIGSGFTSGSVNATGTFSIALSCAPPSGVHRLRVRGVYGLSGTFIDPCNSEFYGETEDYTITIGAPPACPFGGILSLTSQTSTSATLSWTAACATATTWDVEYGPVGHTAGTGTIISNIGNVTTYVLSPLLAGTAYDIYVRANCGGGSFSSWSNTLAIITPPANDEALGAITIVPSSTISCSSNTSGTNVNATPSASTTICSPTIGVGPENDVWFKFVANSSSMNIAITNPASLFGYYPAIQAYSGAVGSLVPMGSCAGSWFSTSATLSLNGLTSGVTYYFRTWHNNGGNGSNNFLICVSKAPSPIAYTVTQTPNITYTSIMSSPTALNFVWQPSTSWGYGDENISNVITMPAGFNFSYQGGLVTGIRANTNGWVSLDGTSTFTQAGSGVVYGNSLTSYSYDCERMKVAPFAQDLVTTGHVNNVATYTATNLNNSIKYDVTGSSPNRIMTIEFAGMELYANPGPNLNYQIKLYETNNKIEFVYGTMEHSNGTSNVFYNYTAGLGTYIPSATAGYLMGARAVDYNSFDELGTGTLNRIPSCNSKVTFTPGTYVTPIPAVPVATAPLNDAPASAQTLTVGATECTSFCGTYFRSNAATASGTAVGTCGTLTNADDDVWFDVTTPALWSAGATDLAIKVIGTTGYTARIQLMDATMTTTLACGVAPGGGLTATALAPIGTLTNGTLYKVRVYHDAAGSATSGYFSICAYEKTPPPINDDCLGAININSQLGTTCSMTNYSTLNATQSQAGCSGTADDDVWFMHTALYPTFTINVQSIGTFNSVLQVFNGTCAGLASVACINNTSTGGLETISLVGASVGTTYYFRVYHAGAGNASGSFGICINSNPPPVNDNCSGAIALTIGSICLSTSGNSNFGSATPAVANLCAGATTDDEVWYSFNKPNGTTTFNVTVAGSANYQTAYEVFIGSCGTLSPVVGGCVNLSSSTVNSTESKLFTGMPSAAGNYFVRVFDSRVGSGSGAHTICVYNGNPPINDNPCTSINLSGNLGNIACCPTIKVNFDGGSSYLMGNATPNPTATPPTGNNLVYYTGSTAFGSSMVGEPTPTCANVGWAPAKTTWFSFMAPKIALTNVTIRTSYTATTFSTVLAAYVLTSGTACAAPVFTQIGCTNTGSLTLTGIALSPYAGQQIYVQLSGDAGANGNYMYSIQGTAPAVSLTAAATSTLTVNIPSVGNNVVGEHIGTVIYYKTVGSTGFVTTSTLAPSTTSYSIGGLLSGSSYQVWAKYLTLSGKAYYSNVVTGTTTTGCAGNAPAPTALPQNPLHCAVQSFSWPAHPLATTTYGYRFYNVLTGNTNYNVTALTGTSFGIGALLVNANYTCFYKVICDGGASIFSLPISYSTCLGAPKQSNTNENTVYEYNGLYFHNVDITEIAAATDNTPADGKTHEVKLNVVSNNEGNENNAGTKLVTTENSFELVPNPTSNNVLVDYTLNTSNVVVTIKLMDVQGRIIAQYKTTAENTIGAYELNLSEVKAGVYLVNVQADGLNATKKLVVNK